MTPNQEAKSPSQRESSRPPQMNFAITGRKCGCPCVGDAPGRDHHRDVEEFWVHDDRGVETMVNGKAAAVRPWVAPSAAPLNEELKMPAGCNPFCCDQKRDPGYFELPFGLGRRHLHFDDFRYMGIDMLGQPTDDELFLSHPGNEYERSGTPDSMKVEYCSSEDSSVSSSTIFSAGGMDQSTILTGITDRQWIVVDPTSDGNDVEWRTEDDGETWTNGSRT